MNETTKLFDNTTGFFWGGALILALGCTPCLVEEEPRPIPDRDNPNDRPPIPDRPDDRPDPPAILIDGGQSEAEGRVFFGSELPVEVLYTPCEGSLTLLDGAEPLATIDTLRDDSGVVIFDLQTAEGERLTSVTLTTSHTCGGTTAATAEPIEVHMVGTEAIVPAFAADFRAVGNDLLAIEGDAIHRVATEDGAIVPVTTGDLTGLEAPLSLLPAASGRLYVTDAIGAFKVLDNDLKELWTAPEGVLLRHLAMLESDTPGEPERVFALGINPETGLVSAAEFDATTGEPVDSITLESLPILAPTAITPDGATLKVGQLRIGAVRAELVEKSIGLGAAPEEAITETVVFDIGLELESIRDALQGRYTKDAALLVLSVQRPNEAPQLVLVDRATEKTPVSIDLDAPLVDWDELDDERLWVATQDSLTLMTRAGEVLESRDLTGGGILALVEADPAGIAGIMAIGDTRWSWLEMDLTGNLPRSIPRPAGLFDFFWEEGRAPVLLVPGDAALPPAEGPALIRLTPR